MANTSSRLNQRDPPSRPRAVISPPATSLQDNPEIAEIDRLKQINNRRLKNAFEDIIQKYSKDFSNVGDEIDLDTGEIIINNGHISRMRDEQDTGLRHPNRLLGDWTQDLTQLAQSRRAREEPRVPLVAYSAGAVDDEDWEDVEEVIKPRNLRESRQSNHTNNTRRRDMEYDEEPTHEDDEGDEDELAEDVSTPAKKRRYHDVEHDSGAEYDDRAEYDEMYTPPRRTRPSHRSTYSPQYRRPRRTYDRYDDGHDVDHEMVQDFAESLTRQITDFVYRLTESSRRRIPANSRRTVPDLSPERHRSRRAFYNPEPYMQPSKRPRLAEQQQHTRPRYSATPQVPQSERPRIPDLRRAQERPRDHNRPQEIMARHSTDHFIHPLLRGSSRVDSDHAHRGVTPGMPSLWSEDEGDVPAPRRSSTALHGTTMLSNPSTFQPRLTSHLQYEIRNEDDVNRHNGEVDIAPGDRADDEMAEGGDDGVYQDDIVQNNAVTHDSSQQEDLHGDLVDNTARSQDAEIKIDVSKSNDDDDDVIIVGSQPQKSTVPDSEDDPDLSMTPSEAGDDENEAPQANRGRARPSGARPKLPWTKKEIESLIYLHIQRQLTWPQVMAHFPHRSYRQVTSRYYRIVDGKDTRWELPPDMQPPPTDRPNMPSEPLRQDGSKRSRNSLHRKKTVIHVPGREAPELPPQPTLKDVLSASGVRIPEPEIPVPKLKRPYVAAIKPITAQSQPPGAAPIARTEGTSLHNPASKVLR